MKIIQESNEIPFSYLIDYELNALDLEDLKNKKINIKTLEKISNSIKYYQVDTSYILEEKNKFCKFVESDNEMFLVFSNDKNILKILKND